MGIRWDERALPLLTLRDGHLAASRPKVAKASYRQLTDGQMQWMLKTLASVMTLTPAPPEP
jgi:hypothetical protein